MAKKLRVVAPGEKGRPTRQKTVTEAAEKGTTLELLVAMRARIATAVEDANTPARDLAALTKRLVEVVRDIDAIHAREAEEPDASDVGDAYDASAI